MFERVWGRRVFAIAWPGDVDAPEFDPTRGRLLEATDGVVSLRGTVPDANRKKLALDTAGKTEGVKRVIDLIKIKP